MCLVHVCLSFFFQAEDGIRDYKVTGVQTCALPIAKFGDPVFAETPSTVPSGTRQAISPVFTLIALSVPHGGFWQGHSFSSQKRAYSPCVLLRRYFSGEPSGCGSKAPMAPSSLAFTKR